MTAGGPDHRTSGPGRAEEPTSAEKRVSWAELFFDLVFVFAITEVSALVRADPTPAGLVRAAIVFVPLYWVWVGTSIRANTHDITSRRTLALFAIALAGMVMALAVPGAYQNRAVMFAAGYWAARLVLGSELFAGTRSAFSVFLVSMVVTGPLLVTGALLGHSPQRALWALAAAVDLATPLALQSHIRRHLQVDGANLAERYGSFVLIALGESVVAIGSPLAGAEPMHIGTLLAAVVAFALCAGLWWAYFRHAADGIRQSLEHETDQAGTVRTVLSYGHLLLTAGIIAVAVGLRDAVAEPSARLGWSAASLLFGGCSLYLGTFAYTHRRINQQLGATRLVAAFAVALILPVAQLMPSLAALGTALAGLCVLTLVEGKQAKRLSASPQ
jgi:low temperature requirement protein LtrA